MCSFSHFGPPECDGQEAAVAGDAAALIRPALSAQTRNIGKTLSCTEHESLHPLLEQHPAQTATGLVGVPQNQSTRAKVQPVFLSYQAGKGFLLRKQLQVIQFPTQ